MDNKVAIIDLGSNTFHLLIAQIDARGQHSVLHKERSFVGLAENGIELLSDASMERGVAALKHFVSILKKFKITDYKIIGTSALRSAENSNLFLSRVRQDLALDIEVIDGSREADLIYKGVAQVADMSVGSHVIMDVGGGSVEFIIVENGAVIWRQSLDLGVGVLYNLDKISDPIDSTEETQLKTYILNALADLKASLAGRSITSIVGASGSFEVIQSINGDPIQADRATQIDLSTYHMVAKRLKASTLEERKTMKGLPESRIKLIVVAIILINTAIELIQPDYIQVSPYALKEGLISEIVTSSSEDN